MFQSTHPHGVRLWSVVKPKEEEKVSIHAPTRGATGPGETAVVQPWVSIHAPTRGATTWSLIRRSLTKGFNPRTHTGCDLQSEKHPLRIPFGFNPRTHTGCDHPYLGRYPLTGGFNPRTHTGCDDYARLIQYTAQSFNPRTHTGCDDESPHSTIRLTGPLFQSTHPHGVRQCAKLHIISQ